MGRYKELDIFIEEETGGNPTLKQQVIRECMNHIDYPLIFPVQHLCKETQNALYNWEKYQEKIGG